MREEIVKILVEKGLLLDEAWREAETIMEHYDLIKRAENNLLANSKILTEQR